MSKLRLFQVIFVFMLFIGLIMGIDGNKNGAVVFILGIIGLIISKILRFIWRD
jgi:hypothetical protein